MMGTEITHTNGLFVHAIGVDDNRAIFAWWMGNADAGQKNRIHTLISKMHANHHWLRCNCQDQESRAYLAPVKVGDSYHLKRLTKRGRHNQNCIFWREPSVTFDDENIKSGASLNNFDPKPPSFLQDDTANLLSNRRDLEQTSPTSRMPTQRGSKMASRMFWLAHVAGTQKSASRPPTASWLSATEKISVSKNIPLKKLLFLSSKVWTDKWADSAFKLCQRNGIKPVCWWVTVITGYCDTTRTATLAELNIASLQIPISADVKIHAGDTSPARFPMLVIFKLGLMNTSVGIQAMYAHPIISVENWMLVDSNLERKTHNNLVEVTKWLHFKHGLNIGIEKPIYNWLDTNERPDFVLVHQSRKNNQFFVVETMGYKNPEYLQRKNDMESNLPCNIYFDQRSATDMYSKEIFNAVAKWALLPN